MPDSEDRTRAVVEAIAYHQMVNGFPPTVRELQEEVGYHSTAAMAYRLDVCERLGLIRRVPRLARSVTLTSAGRALAGLPSEREGSAAG